MRILALLLVAILGFAPGALAADDAWPRTIPWLGCPEPRYEAAPLPAPDPGRGTRVLIVGDSLTRESRAATERILEREGWNPTVRCWGGKTLGWGIDQVTRAEELGQLPATVVIALGTNDMTWEPRPLTRKRMTRMLDLLGPWRTVYWVNLHFDGGLAPSRKQERWFNERLEREAAERGNLTVIDWATIAREDGIRTRDGLHYQAKGSRARARTIAEALAARPAGSGATRGVLATKPGTD